MHSFMQHKTSVRYISWMSYVSQFGWKPACKAEVKWQIDMLIKSTSKMFPGFRDGQRRHRGNCKNMNTKKNEYKKCSRCMVVFYCSKDWQRAHWPVQKKYCKWWTSVVFCYWFSLHFIGFICLCGVLYIFYTICFVGIL